MPVASAAVGLLVWVVTIRVGWWMGTSLRPEPGRWGWVGTQTERYRKVSLSIDDIHGLTVLDSKYTFTGDPQLLGLGIQAYTLGIAWEFDPYFGLSYAAWIDFLINWRRYMTTF